MIDMAIKEVITIPQASDMGCGFGCVEGADGCTLEQILEFYAKNDDKSWGTVSIYRKNDVIRKFDYDIYNNNIFYHHLYDWQYKLTVKEVEFTYSWMNKDIDIYLK